MDEDVIKSVIVKYLGQMRERFSLQKGAGPDIIKDGVALEIKGSDFDLRYALKQFPEYAFKYKDLEIAFPVDVITIDLLYRLYVLESAIKFRDIGRHRSIAIYLVNKNDENEFAVMKFNSVENLLKSISDKLAQRALTSFDAKIEECIKKIFPMISRVNEKVREILEEDAKSYLGYKVSLL